MRKTEATKFWDKVYPEIRSSVFTLCDYLYFVPSQQQAELLWKVQQDRDLPLDQQTQRFATKSGQGVGKTRISCVIMFWRMLQEVDSMGVVTAPTMRQLKTVWLAEFRRMINKAHPIIRKFVKVYKTQVILGKRDNWVINLLSASKPEAAQGLHEDHLTIMIDEASGMDRAFIEQLKGTSTNKDLMFFMIGNPNSRDSDFFEAFTKFRDEWICTTFNAEESELVAKKNIERLKREFGEKSDVYRVRVLGEFPSEDPQAIMALEDLEACAKLDPVELSKQGKGRSFGIDLARFGSNESVIVARKGNAVVKMQVLVKQEPVQVLRRAMHDQEAYGWTNAVFIADAGGLGQGCMSSLYEAKKVVHEFHSEGKPKNKKEYANKITEAYFEFSKLVKARAVAIPNDAMLIKQLSTRCYGFDKHNRLLIEDKDKYSERFEQDGVQYSGSPDRADGVVMAFYEPYTSCLVLA
jgi:hypothetical protein